jgi:hypothetical protein
MSKNKGPELAPYEEYVAQQDWRRRWWKRHWIPSRSDPQPKWHYRIVHGKPRQPQDISAQTLFYILGAILFLIITFALTSSQSYLNTPEIIGIACIIGGIIFVVILAGIDAGKQEK